MPRELEQADPALPPEGAGAALPAHGGREGGARARSRRIRTHGRLRRPCRPGAKRGAGSRPGLRAALAAGRWRRWLLWRSRGPSLPPPRLVSLTSTPGSGAGSPRSRPDGDQVAFAWDGEKARQLRHLPQDDRVLGDPPPHDGPRARQIARAGPRTAGRSPSCASSRRTAPARSTSCRPSVGPIAKLSDQPVAVGPLSWSPDGRWLATARAPASSEPRSRNPRYPTSSPWRTARLVRSRPRARPRTTRTPAFSPDGQHLAYGSCIGLHVVRD